MRRAGLRPGSINGGAWRGDQIVVSFRGHDNALAFLGMQRRSITVDAVRRLRPQTLRTRYGVAFGAPYLTRRGNVIVPIRGETYDGRYLVSIASCSRARAQCTRGPTLPARRWFAVVDNPSRPMG